MDEDYKVDDENFCRINGLCNKFGVVITTLFEIFVSLILIHESNEAVLRAEFQPYQEWSQLILLICGLFGFCDVIIWVFGHAKKNIYCIISHLLTAVILMSLASVYAVESDKISGVILFILLFIRLILNGMFCQRVVENYLRKYKALEASKVQKKQTV